MEHLPVNPPKIAIFTLFFRWKGVSIRGEGRSCRRAASAKTIYRGTLAASPRTELDRGDGQNWDESFRAMAAAAVGEIQKKERTPMDSIWLSVGKDELNSLGDKEPILGLAHQRASCSLYLA